MLNIYSFSKISFSAINLDLSSVEEALRLISTNNLGKNSILQDASFDMLFQKDDRGLLSISKSKSFQLGVFYRDPDSSQTIFLSNLEDGWITLANNILLQKSGSYINFRFSDVNSIDAISAFTFTSSALNQERVVYSMRDPKWVFYEKGTPLWFEDTDAYKARRVKDRLNTKILLEYCSALNLNIEKDNYFKPKGETLVFKYEW